MNAARRLGAAGLVLLALAVGTKAQGLRERVRVLRPKSLSGLTTLSLGVTPSSVSFALVSGSSAVGNTPLTIQTTLTLPLLTTVVVYAYFLSSTAALTGATSSALIPTSCVFGQMTTGLPTSYQPFTQTGPYGGSGASLELVSTPSLTVSHSETDSLSLLINLATVPHLPADTYHGTMYIVAQAF